MKFIYYVCCLAGLLGLPSVLWGQGTGLVLEDEKYNNLPTVSDVFSNSGAKTGELPLKVSLRKYCPEVQNQGDIGSCVGWSTGYAAFTIAYAVAEDVEDAELVNQNAFSALYVYNQAKISDCFSGALFSKCLEVLKEQGDCRHRDFDFPVEGCDRMPNDDLRKQASSIRYEVKDYLTLFRSTEDAKEKIYKTKLSLAERKPVVVGMSIRENFKDLSGDNDLWEPDKGNTTSAGGHAMTVVGYDEGKGAFLLMNSWGKRWGRDGFAWVRYEDFGKNCIYAYQLLVGKKTGVTASADVRQPLKMSGEFTFRYVVPSDADEVVFGNADATLLNANYYKINRTDWEKGQMFQLLTRNITKDRYVYVFSIDPENQARIHWPRSERYAEKFFQLNEGALVPYNNVEIIIPGKDRALTLEKFGTDHVVLLYSERRIDDLVERVEQVRTSSGSFMERLQNAFGSRLVPNTDVVYDATKMRFTATSEANGYIVPLVIQLQAKP